MLSTILTLSHQIFKLSVQPFMRCSSKATINVSPFNLHLLSEGPSETVTVSCKEAVKLYQDLETLRCIETTVATLYKANLITGFCHLYTGQEACAVGVTSAMRSKDCAITAYRCHGWAYLMGVSIKSVIGELTGRTGGCCRGKGGSMHMYGPKFFGGSGIVGAQVPLGAGIAFAAKYRNEDSVCITCYGEGAANNGQIFETFNLSKLWELPVIFVCENNHYSMGTPCARVAVNTKYYTRCEFIPGICVDGMDVLAVQEATRFAIQWCSCGNGPIILELNTYRYYGHSLEDPGNAYRTDEEVDNVRDTRDPIELFRHHILCHNLLTEDELLNVKEDIKEFVEKETIEALSSPEPTIDEIANHLFVEPINKFARGVSPWDLFLFEQSDKSCKNAK